MKDRAYIDFISRQIKKLNTALFIDHSPSILKFPTTVVRNVRTDTIGNIYFTITKPYDDVRGIESVFYGELHFYNKRYNFYVIIAGLASVLKEDHQCFEDDDLSVDGRNGVIIRFRILNTSYHVKKADNPLHKYEQSFLSRLLANKPIHSFHRINTIDRVGK